MARLQPVDVAWFESPAELRDWLDANHATAAERWVGLRRKASPLPGIGWPELVDEVLCVGWIDSVQMPVEGGSAIRITPRRKRSVWSARNLGRVAVLQAEGRMRPAGEAAFAARRDDRTAIYAFENAAVLDEAAESALRAVDGAWDYWEAQPPGYRRDTAHWIVSAKREETRARRLAALVDACAHGKRLA